MKANLPTTMSGGTFADATYALSCARGESFDAFYDHLYDALRTRNIVADAFAGLVYSGTDGAAPGLTRAAADVWAGDAFVGDARFATPQRVRGDTCTPTCTGRRFTARSMASSRSRPQAWFVTGAYYPVDGGCLAR